MAKTYAQYVAEVRGDLEGYDADLCVYYDLADAMLEDKEFKQLAVKKFGNTINLRESVVHSLTH